VKLKTKISNITKTYCFDIDGVICNTKKNCYHTSRPIKKAIKKINQLYSEGNRVIIFTARFMGRSKEKVILAKKKGYKLTYNQLLKWKVKFHKLIFGKPSFDYVIDDKSINFKKNWYKLI
jgi:ribonucleotide monophosphatase NagD (HAD superfamily)